MDCKPGPVTVLSNARMDLDQSNTDHVFESRLRRWCVLSFLCHVVLWRYRTYHVPIPRPRVLPKYLHKFIASNINSESLHAKEHNS